MRSFNADIPTDTSIAGIPTFPHGLNGIFISAGAKIGEHCTIFHQVTIGSNTLKDSKNPGSPIIGDDVFIGAGAKIIGGITVGNHVRIGANCVVTKNIPTIQPLFYRLQESYYTRKKEQTLLLVLENSIKQTYRTR